MIDFLRRILFRTSAPKTPLEDILLLRQHADSVGHAAAQAFAEGRLPQPVYDEINKIRDKIERNEMEASEQVVAETARRMGFPMTPADRTDP